MPCACKKHFPGHPSLLKTMDSYVMTQVNITRKLVAAGNVLSDSFSGYDFTPTVKPQDQCFNCAAKHMGFALALIQKPDYMDFCMCAAQVSLAGSHYMAYNKDLQVMYRDLALKMLLDMPDRIKYMKELLKLADISYKLFKGQEVRVTPNNDLLKQISTDKEQSAQFILAVSRAYCMMFAETGYQELNRMYAVGELSKASSLKVPVQDMEKLREKLRVAWKLLQQPQKDDSKCHSLIVHILYTAVKAHLKTFCDVDMDQGGL